MAALTMRAAPPIGSLSPSADLLPHVHHVATTVAHLQTWRANPPTAILPNATQTIMTFTIDIQLVSREKIRDGRHLLDEINNDPEEELSDGEDRNQTLPVLPSNLVTNEQATLYLTIVQLKRLFAMRDQSVYRLAKDAHMRFHRRQFPEAYALIGNAVALWNGLVAAGRG
ncbi:hypothetical protein LTS09_018083 [Friedmanniomyces endolithicus]|nr:hypothetical protein LTS09_018083 [Friedmanniomyces endolithicus]